MLSSSAKRREIETFFNPLPHESADGLVGSNCLGMKNVLQQRIQMNCDGGGYLTASIVELDGFKVITRIEIVLTLTVDHA